MLHCQHLCARGGGVQEVIRRERERERNSQSDWEKEDRVVRSRLFQRRVLFLGWCCVTNLMGTAPRMRAARGLFGKAGRFIGFLIGGSAVKWLSSLACFLADFLLQWNALERAVDVALRSQKHRKHFNRKILKEQTKRTVKTNRGVCQGYFNVLIFIRGKRDGLLQPVPLIITMICPCKIEPDMLVLVIRFVDMGF